MFLKKRKIKREIEEYKEQIKELEKSFPDLSQAA